MESDSSSSQLFTTNESLVHPLGKQIHELEWLDVKRRHTDEDNTKKWMQYNDNASIDSALWSQSVVHSQTVHNSLLSNVDTTNNDDKYISEETMKLVKKIWKTIRGV